MRSPPAYVLGSDDAEVMRLDAQSAAIAPATALLLRAAGIAPGMRVLDLGTGLGHVALALAELVGPEGAVVGIDLTTPLLEIAERRRAAAGADQVRFLEADARDYRSAERFDAIVARLLLFHLPDAVDVVRHHSAGLRPGGRLVAIDFDLGSARTEPPVALFDTAIGWVEAAFRAAGADPRVGTRLERILAEAGLEPVDGLGLQRYYAPDDPTGPRLLAGIVGALASPIVAAGIATASEIGLDTLEARLAVELAAAGATMLPPAVVGAWGTRA
jgi:ubiquinone/menaquinone biosynthesis C-methylase UbiE